MFRAHLFIVTLKITRCTSPYHSKHSIHQYHQITRERTPVKQISQNKQTVSCEKRDVCIVLIILFARLSSIHAPGTLCDSLTEFCGTVPQTSSRQIMYSQLGLVYLRNPSPATRGPIRIPPRSYNNNLCSGPPYWLEIFSEFKF